MHLTLCTERGIIKNTHSGQAFYSSDRARYLCLKVFLLLITKKFHMNEKIQSVLNSLPHKPGIYLMKDDQGTIIYVGKAISLFNRVRSYFQESTDHSPKN